MSDIRIDERNQSAKERISDEDVEQVVGGVAGIDDLCNWLSKKAGRYIKELFD